LRDDFWRNRAEFYSSVWSNKSERRRKRKEKIERQLQHQKIKNFFFHRRPSLSLSPSLSSSLSLLDLRLPRRGALPRQNPEEQNDVRGEHQGERPDEHRDADVGKRDQQEEQVERVLLGGRALPGPQGRDGEHPDGPHADQARDRGLVGREDEVEAEQTSGDDGEPGLHAEDVVEGRPFEGRVLSRGSGGAGGEGGGRGAGEAGDLVRFVLGREGAGAGEREERG